MLFTIHSAFLRLLTHQARAENVVIIFTHESTRLESYKDPLGQTHSHASSKHCFLLFCFSRFEKWGRTDNMCENNDPYRP